MSAGVTRIDFHFNVDHRVHYACRVTRKARAAGKRLVVYARNAERLVESEYQRYWQLRNVRSSRVVARIEGLDEGEDGDLQAMLAAGQARIQVLALVNPPSFGFDAEPRYLQVTVPLPAALIVDALAVQVANREYQERALAREGLRRMYIGTLTLALFLAVFGAVLLAVLLGNQLIRPLLVLAEGMREVAKGDLRPKAALTARDELAGLTRTFAHMTQDLADARAEVQRGLEQVDAARANLLSGQVQGHRDGFGFLIRDQQAIIDAGFKAFTNIFFGIVEVFVHSREVRLQHIIRRPNGFIQKVRVFNAFE